MDPLYNQAYELLIQILPVYISKHAWKIMIKSGHNFAHATTAEPSWHVQNYDLIGAKDFSLDSIVRSSTLCAMVLGSVYRSLVGRHGQFLLPVWPVCRLVLRFMSTELHRAALERRLIPRRYQQPGWSGWGQNIAQFRRQLGAVWNDLIEGYYRHAENVTQVLFSIYCWAKSQPMRGDVTTTISSHRRRTSSAMNIKEVI